MTKHYILHLDPDARYEWDRCVLRDPITAERPDLAQLIAQTVGDQNGSYLISVRLEVDVLEHSPLPEKPSEHLSEPSMPAPLPQLEELVA
ncbi:hypothetical protein [Leptolyngbya sp. FACHB-261]|uniref:hypothetical protein n=1 Tax=Leptolyngbya sp. FACHB-261 TaxID=2692806 RepID=UPI001684B96E|nr:hypothetical protein [Leptolyngbya sp. FACHB-261]MBD2100140.1 hypothetical protein [Leptolyngbya sp. FACHB-261]